MIFDFGFMTTCFGPILSKLSVTMYMALISTVFALLGGMLFAIIIRMRVPVLDKAVHFISSFLKGVPVLVLLFIFYYAMPEIFVSVGSAIGIKYDLSNPPKMFFAIFAFAITYMPYMCDMILSALDTIPKGQMEACYAMGMTTWQGMVRIIIPQLIIVAVPNFGNHFVNLLKATSVAYMVTIVEMMGAAKNYAVSNQMFLECYVAAALIYWAICIVFDRLFLTLERHTGKYLKPTNDTVRSKRLNIKSLLGLSGQAV